jgi:hypothetical protein
MSEGISDEVLVDLLKARGYEVAKKEQAEPVTQEQVKDWIREEIESNTKDESKPAEQSFAENYARALDRSRSRRFGEEDDDEPDYERWHALQRWLELGDNRISIPYAKKLAKLIPPVAVRLRRDFGSLLALIRAHALLHQATRVRDRKGRIVATLDDYAVVRELLADVISEGVEKTVKPQVREVVEKVRELVDADPGDGAEVSQRQLVEAVEIDKGRVSRNVRAALEGAYLINREERQGRPHRLVPGDPLPDDLEILPPLEELRSC